MGWLDNIASKATGGLVGGGNGPLSGVLGQNYSSGIHAASSALQTGATGVADYYTGGLASLANGWQSKGSQSQLNTPIGRFGQFAAGAAGLYNGAPQSLYNSAASSMGYGSGAAADTGGSNLSGFYGPDAGTTGGTMGNGLSGGGGAATSMPLNDVPGYTPSAGASTAADAAAPAAPAAKPGMSLTQKGILGIAGANALMGMKNRPPAINTDPYGAGAQISSQAQNMMAMYQKGQLLPSDSSRIALWQQSATAQIQDQYARAGLADSTMAQQATQQVGLQAEAMRQQALTGMMNSALNMAGVANSYVTNMVNLQVQQDQQLQQAQQQLMQTLTMYGMQAGG